MHEPLDLRFSPELRDRLDHFLQGITQYRPTLCLMKGHNVDRPDLFWAYGAYGPDNLAALEPEFRARGLPLLYVAEGLVIAIPQPQFLPELRGRTMLFRNGALALSASDGDA